MPVFTGVNFSGQEVVLTEQTLFIRPILDGANIVDSNGTIGWEMFDYSGEEIYVNGVLRG